MAVVRESRAPRAVAKGRMRRVALSLALLSLVAAGAAGYAWHWLKQPPPPAVATAEDALFDGGLVAVGLIDVEKLVALNKYWFGDLDPNTLPMDDASKGLLTELFRGPARFRENLRQVLFSVNAPQESGRGGKLMLLSGRFDADTLLKSLGSAYELDRISGERWTLTKKQKKQAGPVCEKDKPAGPEILYLQLSHDWVMVFDDHDHGNKIWQRLQSGAIAAQDVSTWRQYRSGRLLSLMVLAPTKAGEAVGGMPGMMVHGAATQAPQVTAVAMGMGIEPLKGGLNVNVRLASQNADWIGETESKIRKSLDEMTQDSRTLSPTLAGLFSRLTVAGGADALALDARLDAEILNDVGNIAQEGIASLFGGGMLSGKGEIAEEKIDENPHRYVDMDISRLPAVEQDKYQSPPLYSQSPFAVDIKSVSSRDGGVLELWVEGKVGLSGNEDRRYDEVGKLSLVVASVQDEAGQELLRDESCMERNDLFGRSPNHEPESNTNHHQDHGWVWKHLRLKPGVAVERIARITGELSFSVPSGVQRFTVPLQGGETVEHGGVRFYLRKVKGGDVSYQVSGATDRLLEVRALNGQGKALRKGWSMGSMDGGQVTQSYHGEVNGLEVYIAERFQERKADFILTDIFQLPEQEEKDRPPQWAAPERIDNRRWYEYAKLDPIGLKIDPKDWQIWGNNKIPIAEGNWAPIRLFITHTPQQWGNNPIAHLYFPQLPKLPGVLSGISYRIDEPAPKEGPAVSYHKASYWYRSNTGEVVTKHALRGQPMALNSFSLMTGLEDDQKLERLKGEIIFRLPQRTQATRMALNDLWSGQTYDGVTVTLTNVSRGMFPGYGLKVEGAIERLVNLHGIAGNGEVVLPKPVNYQTGGYWTMTLPFGQGIEEIELITAVEQGVMRYPFDLKPKYLESSD